MKEVQFFGGSCYVKRQKDMVVLAIKHPYRFGEMVKLTKEQAAKLAEMLKVGEI